MAKDANRRIVDPLSTLSRSHRAVLLAVIRGREGVRVNPSYGVLKTAANTARSTVQLAMRRFIDLGFLTLLGRGISGQPAEYRLELAEEVLQSLEVLMGLVPISEPDCQTCTDLSAGEPTKLVPISRLEEGVLVPKNWPKDIVLVPISRHESPVESTTCDGPSRAFHSLHSLTETERSSENERVSECSEVSAAPETATIAEFARSELARFNFQGPSDPLMGLFDSLPAEFGLSGVEVIDFIRDKIRKRGRNYFTSLGALHLICQQDLGVAARFRASLTPRKPPASETEPPPEEQLRLYEECLKQIPEQTAVWQAEIARLRPLAAAAGGAR